MGVARSSSTEIFPSVTSSARNSRLTTGSIRNAAHCVGLGVKVRDALALERFPLGFSGSAEKRALEEIASASAATAPTTTSVSAQCERAYCQAARAGCWFTKAFSPQRLPRYTQARIEATSIAWRP